MQHIGSYVQTNWDWRAAGNFIFGGSGSGLLVAATVAAFPAAPSMELVLGALALVGAGLGLVWLELGRPFRAFNVFFHGETSWMTREGAIAVLLFLSALGGLFAQVPAMLYSAGVLALAFLWCQAQILRAAKGIVAWRNPALTPFILLTGVTEGGAFLLLAGLWLGGPPLWLPYALGGLLVLRTLAWLHYRGRLAAVKAPAAALAQLAAIHKPVLIAGNLLPILLLIAGAALPQHALVLTNAAALLALWAGWQTKYHIITKAAHVQGYGFGTLRRGLPT